MNDGSCSPQAREGIRLRKVGIGNSLIGQWFHFLRQLLQKRERRGSLGGQAEMFDLQGLQLKKILS